MPDRTSDCSRWTQRSPEELLAVSALLSLLGAQEVWMPRFYFDSRIKGKVLRDEEGAEFGSVEEALACAKQGLLEYGADHLAYGEAADDEETLVRSEDGRIVGSIHVKEALAEKTK
jgi:hypothetical protein